MGFSQCFSIILAGGDHMAKTKYQSIAIKRIENPAKLKISNKFGPNFFDSGVLLTCQYLKYAIISDIKMISTPHLN